jgi:hypothetical protein
MAANNLEEPEIFLVAVAPIKVNELFRRAESQYLVFFVKCNAKNVGCALQGHCHFLRNFYRLFIII